MSESLRLHLAAVIGAVIIAATAIIGVAAIDVARSLSECPA